MAGFNPVICAPRKASYSSVTGGSSLNHPNIAAINDFEEANGIQALVLELVEGPTLADVIAGSASLEPSEWGWGPASREKRALGMSIDVALPIARQIVDALERVKAGLQRARAQGKRLGRPRKHPAATVVPGGSVREAASVWGVSKSTAARWIAGGRPPTRSN